MQLISYTEIQNEDLSLDENFRNVLICSMNQMKRGLSGVYNELWKAMK